MTGTGISETGFTLSAAGTGGAAEGSAEGVGETLKEERAKRK